MKSIIIFFVFVNTCLTYSQSTIEKKIYFEFDKAEIQLKSQNSLDSLIKHLNKYYKFSLQIEGFTDPKGTNQYNQKLAEKRAHEVYKYLTQKGIQPNFFKFVGAGNNNSITENTDDKKRFVRIYTIFNEKDKIFKKKTITSSGGTIVSFNTKDTLPRNVKITDFFTSKSMIENNMYAFDCKSSAKSGLI